MTLIDTANGPPTGSQSCGVSGASVSVHCHQHGSGAPPLLWGTPDWCRGEHLPVARPRPDFLRPCRGSHLPLRKYLFASAAYFYVSPFLSTRVCVWETRAFCHLHEQRPLREACVHPASRCFLREHDHLHTTRMSVFLLRLLGLRSFFSTPISCIYFPFPSIISWLRC